MQYLNSSRLFEINSDIIEWDIKSAGMSIIQEYKMISQTKINKLLKLPKDTMNISVGLIGQKDKVFARDLEENFNTVIKLFMEQNNLDIDYDVISVKRDAVFTINREIKKDSIGEFITFIPKNRYHAYIYIKPFEFYLKRNKFPDIKGLSGDKETRNYLLSLHENGILNLIQELVQICETTNMDARKINNFCAEFVAMYKKRELDFDYYREFGTESKFKYVAFNNVMMMDNINASVLRSIDITHNYQKIILPLINLVC